MKKIYTGYFPYQKKNIFSRGDKDLTMFNLLWNKEDNAKFNSFEDRAIKVKITIEAIK